MVFLVYFEETEDAVGYFNTYIEAREYADTLESETFADIYGVIEINLDEALECL